MSESPPVESVTVLVVDLMLVLKSGAALGPVRIPWAEAEQLRGILWPATVEEKMAHDSNPVVHLSSGPTVFPPWLLSFRLDEAVAMSATALLEAEGTEEGAGGEVAGHG